MDKKITLKLKQGVNYDQIVPILKSIGFNIVNHNSASHEVTGVIYMTKVSSLSKLPFVESTKEVGEFNTTTASKTVSPITSFKPQQTYPGPTVSTQPIVSNPTVNPVVNPIVNKTDDNG